MRTLHTITDEQLNIFVDSQAAIKTIETGFTNNPLGKKILKSLDAIRQYGIHTTVHWVPAHENDSHHETVDKLAKLAALDNSQHTNTDADLRAPNERDWWRIPSGRSTNTASKIKHVAQQATTRNKYIREATKQ